MGCPPKQTQEGYEIQMGTNHVGHALLLKLVTPLLLKTTSSYPVRVVSLSSSAWKWAGPEMIQFDLLKTLEGVTPVNRYIQSKMANQLYPQEFVKHYPQLTMVAVDPGEVATQLFSRQPGDAQMIHIQNEVTPKLVRPVEEGVKNQLWAATSEEVEGGLFYEPIGAHSLGLQGNTELSKELWDWTQKELEGQKI